MHDVIIVGGGLAGLVSARLLSGAGLDVAVIEKNVYPFHRVCGEYVSNETLPFLQSIGFDPFAHGAVAISRFGLTSPRGTQLELKLDLGGFGLSRYSLDEQLYLLAQKHGANFLLGEKVVGVERKGDFFEVETGKNERLPGRLVIGAQGKRSNLDAVLKRKFFSSRSPWVGVKHHLRIDHAADLIQLHNFRDGYCGISRVEGDRVCLCYLVSREQVRKYGNIPDLEKNLLSENPHLRRILSSAEYLYEKPQVINEISFAPKPLIEQGILMAGDSGGMIAPLCGNGMAMAIHAAKLLSEQIIPFFEEKTDRAGLEASYSRAWRQEFGTRLRVGRTVQGFFGNPTVTEGFVRMFKAMPGVSRWVVRQTHGEVVGGCESG
ncbi:MAG: NAD(P)/FAD-dependent oxidoreductase [Bacteroidia bacterium]|nr:NAD(P)/FAD-dependent oxidoreductase [Bacteroidia bacterium]